MGMHVGLVAAKTSVARLREAFSSTWADLEVVAEADLPDDSALTAWKKSHEQFVSARDWTADNPGKEVYVLWQDGPWAVMADPSYVLASDDEGLTALSRELGTVLSFIVESASGCAHFSCFENGNLRRRISKDGIRVSIEGTPLPEEAGIDVDNYYMAETEAFGLLPLDGVPASRRYYAICTVDRTDYSGLKGETPGTLVASPSGARATKPWWRFW